MIELGYPEEGMIEQDQLGTCWFYWSISMVPFVYIVYELLVGMADAANKEADAAISSKIRLAQVVTVISWLTCPGLHFPHDRVSGCPNIGRCPVRLLCL